MNVFLCLRLSQKGHAEGPKVGPEQKIKGVEGICSPSGMLHVILPAKLSLRRELYSTIIKKTIWIDLGIILWRL